MAAQTGQWAPGARDTGFAFPAYLSLSVVGVAALSPITQIEAQSRRGSQRFGSASALHAKRLATDRGSSSRTPGKHELKGVPDRWHLYRVVGERIRDTASDQVFGVLRASDLRSREFREQNISSSHRAA